MMPELENVQFSPKCLTVNLTASAKVWYTRPRKSSTNYAASLPFNEMEAPLNRTSCAKDAYLSCK